VKKTWGKHLIIDAYGIETKRLRNEIAAKKLLRDLPIKIKMRPLSKAVVKKVKTKDYPDWGISGFVMLYESHISLHTWPEENYVAMDIYSCKNFDHKEAVKYLKKFWGANGKTKVKVVERG
jgi:S-adenosylmethionine decarboxylase